LKQRPNLAGNLMLRPAINHWRESIMRKNLIALAVAGVFAVPVAALADPGGSTGGPHIIVADGGGGNGPHVA
jgi:hypothetical protein